MIAQHAKWLARRAASAPTSATAAWGSPPARLSDRTSREPTCAGPISGEPIWRRARLDAADLRDADLTGADLRRAHLAGARFSGAKLTGGGLQEADLRRGGSGGRARPHRGAAWRVRRLRREAAGRHHGVRRAAEHRGDLEERRKALRLAPAGLSLLRLYHRLDHGREPPRQHRLLPAPAGQL